MRLRREGPLTFREELALGAALDLAFAPLRDRTVVLSPARARAAVRWRCVAEPRVVPRGELLARIAEASVTAAVMALVFAGSLGGAARQVETPSVVAAYLRSKPPLDDERFLRWLRLETRAVETAPAAERAEGPATRGHRDVEPVLPQGDVVVNGLR